MRAAKRSVGSITYHGRKKEHAKMTMLMKKNSAMNKIVMRLASLAGREGCVSEGPVPEGGKRTVAKVLHGQLFPMASY